MKRQLFTLACVIVLLAGVAGCAGVHVGTPNRDALRASGRISAREVKIASEIGGLVLEVAAEEGQVVRQGDLLFRVDDAMLRAQRAQAEAAVKVARSQRNQLLAGARSQQLDAARAAITSTHELLQSAQADLSRLLAGATRADIATLQAQLAGAQAQAKIAQDAYEAVANGRATAKEFGVGGKGLGAAEEQMRAQLKAANDQVTAAQARLDKALAGATSDEIRGARARVASVQAQWEAAQAQYDLLAAGASPEQVASADALVEQAQAALLALDVQMNKLAVRAPQDGTILERNLEVGQVLAPGSAAFVIGRLDPVQLTVYLPETTYGQINLGQTAFVTVDSHPGLAFQATVTYIASQAEFTPRNVQTVEGRRTTVYAVKLSVPNPSGQVKPGMSADVVFSSGLQ